MLYEKLHDLVPKYMYDESGKVFYSGRAAFTQSSLVYLLGFNPGGDPIEQKEDTIGKNILYALSSRENSWSAYLDECWPGAETGKSLMQINVKYLCRKLGVNPRNVPASNLIFQRARREKFLIGDRKKFIRDCWPVHQAVIDNLSVKIIICFGKSTGNYVRKTLGATMLTGSFVESNARRWKSDLYQNSAGQIVATLTHPGVAYWTVPATDPTELVKNIIST